LWHIVSTRANLIEFPQEAHYETDQHLPILLSSAAVSAAKDSHRKPTLKLVSGSSMAIRNS
jgi:hypothetical protein